MSTCADKNWLVIIDGFTRDIDRSFKLPRDINKLILTYYRGIIRYFAHCRTNLFKLENNKRTIIPIGSPRPSGRSYMVCPSPNGFTKGIHKWTVKLVNNGQFSGSSRRAIGVLTQINRKWIKKNIGDIWPDHYSSFWDGRGIKDEYEWQENEIIEITLNLNTYHVSFNKIIEDGDNTKIIQLRKDQIKPNETYYFGLCIDCDRRCCSFQSLFPRLPY